MHEQILESWDIHNQMLFHIGEIFMTLTQSGHRLDDKILYGIWTWGRWNNHQIGDTGAE